MQAAEVQVDKATVPQTLVRRLRKQEVDRPIAQSPGVVDVEGDGGSATQLVAQRHIRNGQLLAAQGEALLDITLNDRGQLDVT